MADGEEMILLDAFDSEKSAIYAMTADAKGTYVFDSENKQKFDAENSKNIGYWLNHDFSEAALSISDKVYKYIDSEHEWWTEAGNSAGACKEDYSQIFGIGLLSRSEYSKYWGKFGWDNNESIRTSWWLRTGRNTGQSDVF